MQPCDAGDGDAGDGGQPLPGTAGERLPRLGGHSPSVERTPAERRRTAPAKVGGRAESVSG